MNTLIPFHQVNMWTTCYKALWLQQKNLLYFIQTCKMNPLPPQPCQMHLLLPPSTDDVDGETTLAYIHEVVVEGFQFLDDKVIVEIDNSPRWQLQSGCVSVIYENTWRCEICLNDQRDQVLSDSQLWSRIYGTGLPKSTQTEIAMCYRRLDITCDPDPHNDYFPDFEALLLYIRHTFGNCFIFNSTHNEFTHLETE